MKIKEELDFTEFIEKKRHNYETKILSAVLDHYNFDYTDYDVKELTVGYECVKNYSTNILAVRYKGLLIFRRIPLDFNGLKFRYEAPIFNNVSEPK